MKTKKILILALVSFLSLPLWASHAGRSMMISRAEEKSLSLESWMLVDSYWTRGELRMPEMPVAEKALVLEDWMFTEVFRASTAVVLSELYATEEPLALEGWMYAEAPARDITGTHRCARRK